MYSISLLLSKFSRHFALTQQRKHRASTMPLALPITLSFLLIR